MIYELSFPECPPSFNKVGHTGNRWGWSREKKKWQEMIELMLIVEKVPRGLSYVQASATLRFKINRKRDEGNYRTILEKCLGDALTNGGWLSDDTPDEFRFDRVVFLEAGETQEATLILEVTE
jgi:hypothetical protein